MFHCPGRIYVKFLRWRKTEKTDFFFEVDFTLAYL
jgi:hypothetical protein